MDRTAVEVVIQLGRDEMVKQAKANERAGRVKIRLIEFEVEGGDQSIQESLKSIAAALNRNSSPVYKPRLVGNQSSPEGEEYEEETEEEDGEESIEVGTSSRVSRPARRPPTPNILDINFSDVNPTLKEFVSEKGPKQVLQKYLVIAYWLKHFKAIADLTQDHFFTAFRHLQWTVPKDPGGPIKDLRHKRRTQMGSGTTPGTSSINHIGENIVLEMKNADE
jgi:hypothetical protein